MYNMRLLITHLTLMTSIIQMSICKVKHPLSNPYDGYYLLNRFNKNPYNNMGKGRSPPIPTPVKVAQDVQKPEGSTCGLCLIIDEEFSHAYNIKDETTLKVTLHAVVDQASWIFRSTDWDNDGIADNIGFKIISISYGWRPYEYETTTDYETPRKGLELLKRFAKLSFNECCLGVGFTNRPFLYGLDGIAFGASDNLLGGICDHRAPKEESMTNMNAVLISGRGPDLAQLSPSQITRAFVHALGHAFGVHAHDNEYTDPDCWGFGPNERPAHLSGNPMDGHYLMWTERISSKPSVNRTNLFTGEENEPLLKNSLTFSRCSRFTVNSVLVARKKLDKCFQPSTEPFCGNGIVEGLELCDCGGMFDCMEQTCCGSRQSPKPCSIISAKGCPTNVMLRISDPPPGKNSSSSSAASYSELRFRLDILFTFILTSFALLLV